jgi:hypothetical protein
MRIIHLEFVHGLLDEFVHGHVKTSVSSVFLDAIKVLSGSVRPLSTLIKVLKMLSWPSRHHAIPSIGSKVGITYHVL